MPTPFGRIRSIRGPDRPRRPADAPPAGSRPRSHGCWPRPGPVLRFRRGALQGQVVVGLPPAGQHIGVVDSAAEDGVLLDRGSARRAHDRGKRGRVQPDLVMAVAVEIEHLPGEPLAPAELAFREGQLAPDGVAKVRQVQAAEHAVPIRVVALGTADGPSGLGRDRRLRRQSADSACIFLCIRFDSEYFTRKLRQCAPRTSAPSGPAMRASPEIALQAGEPERRHPAAATSPPSRDRSGGQIGEAAARHRRQAPRRAGSIRPRRSPPACPIVARNWSSQPLARRPTPSCLAIRRISRRRRPAPRAVSGPRSSRR